MQGLLGKRKFTFINYGGSYQLRIEKAEDLEHLDELDDPFWMATSAPIDQMICDPVALEFLDVNRNGRIISGELRRTRRWLFRVLRSLEGVTEGREHLRLEDIDTDDPEGTRLLIAAQRILENLDRVGSPTISLVEIRDTKGVLAKGAVNGDGILPPECVGQRDLQALLHDIAETINARMRLTRGLAHMLAPDPVHPGSLQRLRRDLIRQAIGRKSRRVRGPQ